MAVSKAISEVENRGEEYYSLLEGIFPFTGRSFVVGITGPPGTGKSSIVDRLVKIYRKRGRKVGVLAIDPTSPVSGGAILGDRVRMLSHTLDKGVYIRSMASRGEQGGLSRAARGAARVLDAAGNDIVFLETVGTGQAEVEVVRVADMVVVVLMPELGDEVQAVKAGLMEIGDIFAVNKSDLPGADKVLFNLRPVLGLKSGWHQSALKISAMTGEGLEQLVSKIDECRDYLEKSRALDKRRVENAVEELLQNVSITIAESAKQKLRSMNELEELSEKIAKREVDPETATRVLLSRFDLGKPKLREGDSRSRTRRRDRN